MSYYEHTFNIGLRDVGISKQLTNKAILGFMEDIGAMHSDVAGYGLNDIPKTHVTWILLRMESTNL